MTLRAVERRAPPVPARAGPEAERELVASGRERARTRLLAAAAAVLAGLVALGALVVAYAIPALLPFAAPVAVALGALAFWGTARANHMSLAAKLERNEEENRRLSRSLEALADKAWEIRESEERYRNLIEAREKAEAASLSKSRFLATVSHEFRTPLNGILGLTDLLLETPLTPDQETYARGVHSSGEALLALVDDILDFSKIEAGHLDLRPEPADIDALLQEIVELLAARAHGRGIDIAADVDPALPARVTVDATRLRQVLLNLAGNGVKFTEAGGVTVRAALAATREGRAQIVFSVLDSGPGVAPEDVERIFGEFEQADSALTRRHGGTGLGLAISRRIVRRMGGDISLAARAGGGSVFAFTLDLGVVEPARPVARDLSGRRVLVLAVDGAEPGVLGRSLANEGAEVRVVASVNEAAALVGAAAAALLPYHAALIDRRIAVDIAAVLGNIRAAAGSPVPAAILIEPGGRTEVEALRHAGFDAYLVRPVRRASLKKIVLDIAATRGSFRVDPTDARPLPPPPARRAARGLEILLAEDNEINALLLRAVLEQLGHTVTEVRDGAAAVTAAAEGSGRFALIFMDLHMPVLDGLAAARAIRADEVARGLPRTTILALTADVLAETRAAARAAGIDAVLDKPITPDRLRHLLGELAAA